MLAPAPKRRFTLVLIKPSHYDDDGYVIQWMRSAIPSNTLAALYGLALDCAERHVLGEDVEIDIVALDETNTRIRPDRIAKLVKDGGIVGFVGVQSNQFPHAMDLARALRKLGVTVAIGGFHVSGTLAMIPGVSPELQEAMDLGISLFAGEAEGRLEQFLLDAYQGTLKPLYNFMDDLPNIQATPMPLLPATRVKRTGGRQTSFDAGRGCPFQCSFCTIINVQGRVSRRRSPDDVEAIVRRNLEQGVDRFFITDDNFARNKDWEAIFDRLIVLRERDKLDIKFVIQVDTLCHKIPHFIEKAARAGVARVFIGMESINPESLLAAKKRQNKITEYRKMLLEWKKWRVTTCAGYILGFPNDTPEALIRDVEIIKRELPIDLLEFFCLTPLPGSEDHQKLFKAGVPLDPDLNKYDLEHVCTAHQTMTKAEWEGVYRKAWETYYSTEHIKTVMRRGAASNISPGKLMFLLLWFYGCITIEKIHPLEGGYLRRKYRRDRRPSMPRENPLIFYPKYAADIAIKHVKALSMIVRFGWFRRQLRHDKHAREYTDLALTPVVDNELDALEMFTATESSKAAVEKARKQAARLASAPPAAAE